MNTISRDPHPGNRDPAVTVAADRRPDTAPRRALEALRVAGQAVHECDVELRRFAINPDSAIAAAHHIGEAVGHLRRLTVYWYLVAGDPQ